MTDAIQEQIGEYDAAIQAAIERGETEHLSVMNWAAGMLVRQRDEVGGARMTRDEATNNRMHLRLHGAGGEVQAGVPRMRGAERRETTVGEHQRISPVSRTESAGGK